MELCCGFFDFAAPEEEENPFAPPPEAHKHKKRPSPCHRHAGPKKKGQKDIPQHHAAARASTVAKGNGTRDHCSLPKPTGVAWARLAAMMPITDQDWELDFWNFLKGVEAEDLLRPSSADGSTILMFACEHRDALALSLILVELNSYELRHAAITRRNAAGWNAACYVNDVPAGHPIAVLLGEEMSQVGIEEGERETHCLPAAPRTPSPFGKVGSFFKHAKKPDQ